MADEHTDSLLDAALDTSKDYDSYVLDEHSGEEGDATEDAVSRAFYWPSRFVPCMAFMRCYLRSSRLNFVRKAVI